MNHSQLSCQHRAVLIRHSRLQDTRVSLLLIAAPVSSLEPGEGGTGTRDTPGAALRGGNGICTLSIF